MKKGTAGIIGTLVGAAAGAVASKQKHKKDLKWYSEKIDKFKGYYNMLNQWLCLKQEGRSLKEYFDNKGYKTVAIYGMGEMGNRLYEELKNTDIEVKYAIDKNAATTYSELTVLELEDELPEADVMVVTATFAFDDIEEELNDKVVMPIVSLDDVVYEI